MYEKSLLVDARLLARTKKFPYFSFFLYETSRTSIFGEFFRVSILKILKLIVKNYNETCRRP